MTLILFLTLTLLAASTSMAQQRPRARDLGIAPGTLPAGPLNAITDVAGVAVGQTTVREGDSVRTGVTAIVPHADNLFHEREPAALLGAYGFVAPAGDPQPGRRGEEPTAMQLQTKQT